METDVEVTEDRTGDPLLRRPHASQLCYACKCWFLRRGENRSTQEKTSRSRVENQQTQPTYGVESGNRSWATLVEGECSHHCASPAIKAGTRNIFFKAMIDLECGDLGHQLVDLRAKERLLNTGRDSPANNDCNIEGTNC